MFLLSLTRGKGAKLEAIIVLGGNPSSGLFMPQTQILEMDAHFPLVSFYLPPLCYFWPEVESCASWIVSSESTKIQRIFPSKHSPLPDCQPVPALFNNVFILAFWGEVNRLKGRQFPPGMLIAVTLILWQHIATNKWKWDPFPGKSTSPYADFTEQCMMEEKMGRWSWLCILALEPLCCAFASKLCQLLEVMWTAMQWVVMMDFKYLKSETILHP